MEAVFKIPAIPSLPKRKRPSPAESPEKASSKKTSKKSLKRERSVEREKLSPEKSLKRKRSVEREKLSPEKSSLEKVSKKNDAVLSEVRDEKTSIQTGDIFPSDVTRKLENWQHLADTNHVGKICYRRIVDEAIPFIPVLDSKSKKIYYTKIDLKPQLKKNLKYSLKPSEKEDDWDSECLEKVEKRLKRPVCFSGKKADVRLSYRWRNIFFVKRFFTTGIRKTNNAEIHLLQIGENPLYLFEEKCTKSEMYTPRTFDSKILTKNFKRYSLAPTKIYVVPEETSYCLVAYNKTTFAIDKCSRKFVERLERKKKLTISKWIPNPYEEVPPTPFLDRFTDWTNDDEGLKIEDGIDSTEKGNSHAFENCLVQAFVPDADVYPLIYLLPETSLCPPMEATQELQIIDYPETSLCPPMEATQELPFIDYPETSLCPPMEATQELPFIDYPETSLCPPMEATQELPFIDYPETSLCPPMEATQEETIYPNSSIISEEQEMSDDEEFEKYQRSIEQFLDSLRSSPVFQEQRMPETAIKEVESQPPECSRVTQFDRDLKYLEDLIHLSDELSTSRLNTELATIIPEKQSQPRTSTVTFKYEEGLIFGLGKEENSTRNICRLTQETELATIIPENPSQFLSCQPHTELATFKDEEDLIFGLSKEEIAEFNKKYL